MTSLNLTRDTSNYSFTITPRRFGPIEDPNLLPHVNPSDALVIHYSKPAEGTVNDATYVVVSPNPGSGEAWIAFPLNDVYSDWTFNTYLRMGSFDQQFVFEELTGKKDGASLVPIHWFMGPFASNPPMFSLYPNRTANFGSDVLSHKGKRVLTVDDIPALSMSGTNKMQQQITCLDPATIETYELGSNYTQPKGQTHDLNKRVNDLERLVFYNQLLMLSLFPVLLGIAILYRGKAKRNFNQINL